ncbi:MAG: energy-coupling factor transporter transmembrane protein EcfT [Clostridia bacterium]|nr:energy-coupling factor transporter transmembrane protein EcfT [Clostridia bacterium]
MKNIAFGQYYPARSPLHAMDARVKVILSILYIVAAFLCKNVLSFGALLLSALFLLVLSRIPPRIVLRALRPLFFIMLFTAALNLFFATGSTVLFSFWRITVYVEGLYSAVFMLVRIIVLIFGTSIFLTYTTTPIALTDAIESLLSPLRIFKIPVHEFAMMMSIALRFIPTLMEETNKIMNAQKARGVDFSSGGLLKRAKALVPILIPLIVSSFRRADELAMAMECRCYRGGKGRTKMTVPHLHLGDFVALALMVAFGAGLIYLNHLGYGYTM